MLPNLPTNEFEVIIRLIIAICLGGVIGIERETLHKPAGFRTTSLVSLGSCLFVALSMLSFPTAQSYDPVRVLSQVVVGIGFIGGGIIMTKGHEVSGVTTAASLWVSSALGAAVAFGLYTLAISVTILVLAVLEYFGKIDDKLRKNIEIK